MQNKLTPKCAATPCVLFTCFSTFSKFIDALMAMAREKRGGSEVNKIFNKFDPSKQKIPFKHSLKSNSFHKKRKSLLKLFSIMYYFFTHFLPYSLPAST